jgi:hypothetical protein
MAAVDVISLSKEDFLRCKESISSKVSIVSDPSSPSYLGSKAGTPSLAFGGTQVSSLISC